MRKKEAFKEGEVLVPDDILFLSPRQENCSRAGLVLLSAWLHLG